jgi:hypothetical protein
MYETEYDVLGCWHHLQRRPDRAGYLVGFATDQKKVVQVN